MTTLQTLSYKISASPVGDLTLVANTNALIAILWENDSPTRVKLPPPKSAMKKDGSHPVLVETERQLSEYFQGKRIDFELPLEFHAGTDFQKRVWKALTKISYGKTRSYLELAQSVGSPKGYRAVGSANGKNPLSIVVPCHRVIAASGELAGFAGGIAAKRFLLDLERVKTVKL